MFEVSEFGANFLSG